MKVSLICLVVFCSFICCNNNKQQNTNASEIKNTQSMSDTTFEYHFHILDSASKVNAADSIYTCCTQSIKFMEVNTGINAHSDGTLLGKLSFSKEDLQKWHEWYEKKYEKKNN